VPILFSALSVLIHNLLKPQILIPQILLYVANHYVYASGKSKKGNRHTLVTSTILSRTVDDICT
jgi:hypothetical protein